MSGTTGQETVFGRFASASQVTGAGTVRLLVVALGPGEMAQSGGDGFGVVFDVSMRGAKVMSEAGIQRGDRLSVSLSLPNQVSPMTVERGHGPAGSGSRWYGLEFVNLSSVAEMRLRKFIALATKPAS